MPFSSRSVYLEVSSRWCHGSVADLDPAQPLHPDIGFPAGDHRAHRIAVLRVEHLPVHAIGDEDILERLVQGQRTRHCGRVAAFQQQPFGLRPHPGLLEQNPQRHAGMHHAMDHAVGELRPVELGAAPLHAGIGGTFAEIHPVDARHPLDVVEREDERPIDQAMQHEPVVGGIELGDAGMVTLEAQSVGCDHAVERVQRGEADRALRTGREPLHVAAYHARLVRRRLAVLAHRDPVAEETRPIGNIRRLIGGVALAGSRRRSERARAACRDGRAQKPRREVARRAGWSIVIPASPLVESGARATKYDRATDPRREHGRSPPERPPACSGCDRRRRPRSAGPRCPRSR